MFIKRDKGPVFVTFSDGSKMSRADLPPRDTKRWVASRKASVVRAVNGGLISQGDACARYGLPEEEYLSWALAVKRHGEKALKTTSLQKYRQP